MDLVDIGRYFAALLLVLALVGGAGLALRRFGMPGLIKPQGTRRLELVETLTLGPRQKLLLLRRDGVEHLVFAGPEGACVVESGFPAAAAPRAAEPAAP